MHIGQQCSQTQNVFRICRVNFKENVSHSIMISFTHLCCETLVHRLLIFFFYSSYNCHKCRDTYSNALVVCSKVIDVIKAVSLFVIANPFVAEDDDPLAHSSSNYRRPLNAAVNFSSAVTTTPATSPENTSSTKTKSLKPIAPIREPT